MLDLLSGLFKHFVGWVCAAAFNRVPTLALPLGRSSSSTAVQYLAELLTSSQK
jgi:hypothetical protein